MNGVTGYEFQCRQDMTSRVYVGVCGGQAIYSGIQVSMATGRRAHGLPLSSLVGHWLLPSVLFAGWAAERELNFRLLCAVSPGHKLPTAPPLLAKVLYHRPTDLLDAAPPLRIPTFTSTSTTTTAATSATPSFTRSQLLSPLSP